MNRIQRYTIFFQEMAKKFKKVTPDKQQTVLNKISDFIKTEEDKAVKDFFQSLYDYFAVLTETTETETKNTFEEILTAHQAETISDLEGLKSDES